MSRTRVKWVLGLSATLALLLALGFGLSTVFAKGGPTRISGGGEATAAEFVTYNRLAGGTQNVPSINTIGNRITFGLNATQDGDGNVHGRMQLVDHDIVFEGNQGLVIHSDVAILTPHPTLGAPVDAPPGNTFRMVSSSDSVMVNGERRPGWAVHNAPVSDGGEPGESVDTICFEVFDADGVKILQWSAFLSAGNVQIVP